MSKTTEMDKARSIPHKCKKSSMKEVQALLDLVYMPQGA